MTLNAIDFSPRLADCVEKIQQLENYEFYTIIRLQQEIEPKNKYIIVNQEQLQELFSGNHQYSAHEVSLSNERKLYLDLDLSISIEQKLSLEQDHGLNWEEFILNIVMDNIIQQIEVNNKELLIKHQPKYAETCDKSLFYKYFDKYSTSRTIKDCYKMSWHLIFMPNDYFVTIEDLKHSMGFANAQISKQICTNFPKVFKTPFKPIDSQVYSKNSCLRLLGCSKLGEYFPKKSHNQFNLQDPSQTFRPLVSKIITTDGEKLIRLHLFKTMEVTNKFDSESEVQFNSDIATDMNSLIKLVKEKCKESGYKGEFKNYKQMNSFISIYFIYKDQCEFCDRKHSKQDHHFGICWENSNYIYINCFRNDQNSNAKRIKLYDFSIDTTSDSVKENDFEKIKIQSKKYNEKYDSLEQIGELNIEKLNEPILNKSYCSYGNFKSLFIKSAMGTGKTVKLMEYITKFIKENEENSMNPDFIQKKIFVISFRISFSQDYLVKVNKELEKQGLYSRFQIYNELNVKQISNSQYLIIQIESLNKLGICNLSPDLLILDESEHIFQQINSSLSTDESKNYSVFQALVCNSKKLIAIDAFMGERTIHYIQQCRQCDCQPNFQIDFKKCEICSKKNMSYLIDNEFRPKNNYNFFMGGQKVLQQWYDKLENYLRNGKNIAIPCNNANMAETIYEDLIQKLPELKSQICIYTQNLNTKGKFYDLKDVQSSWKKYKVLIYTPTILAGISFEQKHYDAVFGFYQADINPVETFQQMLGRIRDLKDKEFNIFIKKQQFVSDVKQTVKEINQQILQKAYISCNVLPCALQFTISKSGELIMNDSGYYLVYLYNKKILHLSQKEPLARFLNCIGDQQQFTLIQEKDAISVEKIQSLHQKAKERKQQRHEQMIHSDLLTQEQVSEILEKQNITETEQNQLSKFFLFQNLEITPKKNVTEKQLKNYFQDQQSIKIWQNTYKYLNIISQFGSLKKARQYHTMKFNTNQINTTLQNDPRLAELQLQEMELYQTIERISFANGQIFPFFLKQKCMRKSNFIQILYFLITFEDNSMTNVPFIIPKFKKIKSRLLKHFPKNTPPQEIIKRCLILDEQYKQNQGFPENLFVQQLEGLQNKKSFLKDLQKTIQQYEQKICLYDEKLRFSPEKDKKTKMQQDEDESDLDVSDEEIANYYNKQLSPVELFLRNYNQKIQQIQQHQPEISLFQQFIRHQIIWAFVFQENTENIQEIAHYPEEIVFCGNCKDVIFFDTINCQSWHNYTEKKIDQCLCDFTNIRRFVNIQAKRFNSMSQVLKILDYNYIQTVQFKTDADQLEKSIVDILSE